MSVETLDRLAGIIDGLAPLADAGPGEPVRADDWNTVVAGVQELARIAVARERTADEQLAAEFSRLDHGHAGAADLSWFDADTRSLVEGGRSQRADLAAELRRTQRDLRQVLSEVDGLRLELDAVKRQIDEVDDRDRDRRDNVDRLAGRVEGLSDNTTSIADVRRSVGEMDTRVGEALAFRDELVDVDGARIDIAALRGDVGELLTLRENLTAADGRLVEYRDFERRLVALEERPAEPDGGPGFDVDEFRGSLLDDVDQRLAGRFDGIDSDVSDLRDEVAGLDGRTVSALEGLSTHTAQITALQTTATTVPGLRTRLDTAETRIAGHDTAIATLGPLRDRLTAAESAIGTLAELGPRVTANEAGLAQANGRLSVLDALSSRVTSIEQVGLARIDQRLQGLESNLAESRAETSGVIERVTVLESRSDDLGTRFDRVEALTTANRRTVDLLARDLQDVRTRLPAGPVIDPGLLGGGGVER